MSYLNKNVFAAGLVFAICFAMSSTSTANQIPDTVVVGEFEWAQTDLFESLSWNDINLVCPGGSCGPGFLNGFQMDGWTWASRSEVGDLLFAAFPYTMHPGGIGSTFPTHPTGVPGDVFGQWVGDTGFRFSGPTVLPLLGLTASFVTGLNSDELMSGRAGFSEAKRFVSSTSTSSSFYTINSEPALPLVDEQLEFGAWFFRDTPAPVPVPPALVLLLAPLSTLVRFRKAEKTA